VLEGDGAVDVDRLLLQVCDTLFVHPATKRILRRQLCAIQFFERIEPIVRKYAFCKQ
jgi:hypothetical protein